MLNIGRKGRLYVVQEAGGYGVVQDGSNGSNTLSAAVAGMRHIEFKATFDPFNRATTTEKKTSPGTVIDLDRRTMAALSGLTALLRPSGTLNTVPEADPVLEAAFGSKTSVVLATTVSAAPAVGGATLTSAAGLSVGDALLITVGTKKYGRFITAVDTGTGVTTWAPDLPSAPIVGAAVKAGITYKLTTDLAISLAFLHCLSGWRRELRGVGIDKLSFALDANAEVQITASGPAADQKSDADAVADPTSITTVGGNPPSGIIGETYIGNTAYLMKKAGVDITNGLVVRNEEYGAASDSGIASELYRSGRRAIALSLDAYVETAATLYDLAKAGTRASFFNQTGRTEGNIIALYAPQVYWKPADADDPDGPSTWTFKGEARESADGANDELYLALM